MVFSTRPIRLLNIKIPAQAGINRVSIGDGLSILVKKGLIPAQTVILECKQTNDDIRNEDK